MNGLEFASGAMSAAVGWLVTVAIRHYGRRSRLVDIPNERSFHRIPTPRGGGLGIIVGAATGLLLASFGAPALIEPPVSTLFGAACLVAAVGLADDVRKMAPTIRLAVHAAAAGLVVAASGPLGQLPLPAPLDVHLSSPFIAWTLPVLWIVAVTNFFNFMDGIDGLAAGQAIVTCLAVMAAGWSREASLTALVVGSASAGFLKHNWSPARVFMGDIGSGFLGFVLAALPMLAPADQRGQAVLTVAVALALFLLDPLVTLCRRVRAGCRLTEAHRWHTYQQFLSPGDAAGRLAGCLIAAGWGLSILGAAAFRWPVLRWPAVVVALSVYLVERWLAGKARPSSSMASATRAGGSERMQG